MKLGIWIAVVSIAVVGGVVLYVHQPGIPVDVAVVKTGTVRTYVEERAVTRLPRVARIAMPLTGRVLPIAFREGMSVRKGQVVARLDDADLKTDLSEATAREQQFEQLLVSLGKTVLSAEAQRDSRKEKAKWADEEFRRIRAAFEKGGITKSQLYAAELQKLESAFEAVKEAFTVQAFVAVQKAIEIGKRDAAEQRARRKRDADRAVIRSPVAGTVLKRHVSNERTLTAGEILLEVGNLDELEIAADVLTRDAVRIRVGQIVDISGAAVGPQPAKGTVARIFPRGFKKSSSLGVDQQRVRIIIRFNDGERKRLRSAGRRLGVDYRVRVRIYLDKRENTLTVPRSAVFRNADGQWHAFVVRDTAARRVALEVGLMNDDTVEVRKGLRDGDRVIVAPESTITDGTKVEVR